MKRYFVYAALLILLTEIMRGQPRIGLVGGVFFSGAEQTNFYQSKASSLPKYYWGGILEVPMSQGLSIQIEPRYIEKGTYARPMEIAGYVPEITFEQSFAEFPLLLKYSFGRSFRPHVEIGPTIGAHVSSRLRGEVRGPLFGRLELELDASDLLRDIEYSLEFGGGADIELDEYILLTVGARYSFGLNSIIRQGSSFRFNDGNGFSPQLESDSQYSTRGFRVNVGITFPLQLNAH